MFQRIQRGFIPLVVQRQRYCIDPVLLEKCVLTKKEDFVEFTILMNEALLLEEAKEIPL